MARSDSRGCAGVEAGDDLRVGNFGQRRSPLGIEEQRHLRRGELVGHAIVDPLELDTNVAGVRKIAGDVVELVGGQRELQPRKRQHGEP